jgi:hypothetical protein
VEALIAAVILLAASGLLFHFTSRSERLARAQPDAADVNQRLRVAAGMIARDLTDAGAGDAHGELGTLAGYFPPIVPARTGAQRADPELAAFPDRISIVHVSDAGWYGRLAADLPYAAADLPIDIATPGCPSAGVCGFSTGTRAAIFNTSGLGAGYDLFSATLAAAGVAHGPPNPPFSQAYARASAAVVPIEQRVYYLDRATSRLMVYDGYKTALPLADNIVHLEFAYFVDPHPASVALPADASGNCVYGPGDPPVPLLAPLGDSSLVPVPLGHFEDGPYCGLWPQRFDGDLLRIRRVRVTLRAQAGQSQVRGQGAHFVNAGSSNSELSSVRDFEVTFDVAPRNMIAAR